jgi:hypothetical protein
MRTIHYSIRLFIMLVLISLIYCGGATLFHQAIQTPILVALLFIVPGTERLWALLEWMSPVVGTVNMKEQERTQKRIVEHQLSRSQRYGSQLVIAAMRERKRTSLHLVEKNLRDTDIVLRDSSGCLLVLMPDTTIEHANSAFQRMSSLIPVKDVAVMDEKMLQEIINARSGHISHGGKRIPPGDLRKICTMLLNQRLTGLSPHEHESANPAIYNIFEMGVPKKQYEISKNALHIK